MTADVDGEEQRCYCPCTGRVGNLDIVDRSYLLSEARDTDRKTKYTVEAISLNRPKDQNKSWIGINQNCANRHVEYCLKNREGHSFPTIQDEKPIRLTYYTYLEYFMI